MADRYDDTRGTRAEAGPGMERPRLEHLSDLDGYTVADQDPDIRGWEVRSTDGRDIGKVEDLIVDTGLLRVRYMEVKLDRKALGLDEDRHVLLPIGTARLDEEDDTVLIDRASSALPGIPAYARGRLDREYETSLLSGFGGGRAAGASADFYDREHFDEGRFWSGRREGRENAAYLRRAGAGDEVDVRRRVEAERVREPTKERNPVDRKLGGDIDREHRL